MNTDGWIPDLPDHRDFSLVAHAGTISHWGQVRTKGDEPTQFDASRYCSPVENQGALGSCTANAVVGLAEYLERRAKRAHVDGSRLFNYRVARTMHGWNGDTGMYIRTAMKALCAFGIPPEKFWPYDPERLDDEPGAFVYAYAQRFRGTNYYRVDELGRDRVQVLNLLKTLLRAFFPVAFGFRVYSFGDRDGAFPMPEKNQKPYGGHAVMAVGYDDHKRIGESVGALRIRNSWGTGWGQSGYGWLPYGYVTQGLSADFWTLFNQQYLID